MTAEETLEIVSKQWCSLEDLMKISQVGRNSALKIKRNIRDKLTKQGYMVPKHVVPMKEVVDYLDINISYLESRIKKGDMKLIEELDTSVNGKIKCRKTDILFYRIPTFYFTIYNLIEYRIVNTLQDEYFNSNCNTLTNPHTS